MSWVKKSKAVFSVFDYIWNNLIEGWEVWNRASESMARVEDAAGQIKEVAEEQKEELSKDFADAKRYVDEGVSEWKEVYKNIREVF